MCQNPNSVKNVAERNQKYNRNALFDKNVSESIWLLKFKSERHSEICHFAYENTKFCHYFAIIFLSENCEIEKLARIMLELRYLEFYISFLCNK